MANSNTRHQLLMSAATKLTGKEPIEAIEQLSMGGGLSKLTKEELLIVMEQLQGELMARMNIE